MNILNGIILSGLLLLGQYTPSGPVFAHSGGAPVCTSPPTTTYRWAAYNAANLCGTTGGSSCTTNGQAFYQATDEDGANNAVQTTVANQPTYVTNAINTLPAMSFTASSLDYMLFNTHYVPAAASGWYVVVKFNTMTANNPYFGPASFSALNWEMDNAGQGVLTNTSVAVVGASTTTSYTTGVWYAFAVTYDSGSGAWAMYNVHGGAANADGSGTYGGAVPTGAIYYLAANAVTSEFLDGQIAEEGYFTGTSTAGIGAYIQACYGI